MSNQITMMELHAVGAQFYTVEGYSAHRIGLYADIALASLVSEFMTTVLGPELSGLTISLTSDKYLVRRTVDQLEEFMEPEREVFGDEWERGFARLQAEYVQKTTSIYNERTISRKEFQRLIDLVPSLQAIIGRRRRPANPEEPMYVASKPYVEIHSIKKRYVGAYRVDCVAQEVLRMLYYMDPALECYARPVEKKVIICSGGTWLRMEPDLSTRVIPIEITIEEAQRLIDF